MHIQEAQGALAALEVAREPLASNHQAQLPPKDQSLERYRAIYEYAERKSKLTPEQRIKHYNEEKALFESAISTWLPKDRDALRMTLEATRFIDWAHMAPDLIKTFRSRGRLSILERDLPHRYNRNNHPDDPEFRNIREVNKFLKTTELPPGLPRLLEVHRRAMKGRVDGIKAASIGKVRSVPVTGDETSAGLSRVECSRIQKNPYLSFQVSVDSGAHPKGAQRIRGEILYPDAATVKPEALQRIEQSHPDVHRRVSGFQSKPRELFLAARDQQTDEFCDLTRELISALVEERYQRYFEDTKELQTLSTPDQVLKYIKATALLHRDLISIHPLEDGNGRTVRNEVLYALFDRVGISRPRLNNPDADILYSPSDWVTEVERGILSTDALYRDIAERVARGLRVENSPELTFSNLVREVGIELRFRGSSRRQVNASLKKVDPCQFSAFIDTRFMLDRGLERAFQTDPVSVFDRLRNDYKAFAKNTLVYGHIPNKGVEQLGVNLIDFDFRSTFGILQADDKGRWEYKMNRWYSSALIWRGLPFLDAEISREEVLDIFRSLGSFSLSNRTASLVSGSHKSLLQEVQRDFDRYNQDLVSGALTQMVRGHVEEQTEYDTSYGLSTSRKWGIAAGFAWGRGALGYDNQEVARRQGEVKSRVVIGAYQANKDVDVRRFKLIDPSFSYKFGRQQEILSIGGIDPDSIMVVHLLDSKRRISTSFARNRAKPHEVWEIKGGFHPDSADLKELPEGSVRGRYDISQPNRHILRR